MTARAKRVGKRESSRDSVMGGAGGRRGSGMAASDTILASPLRIFVDALRELGAGWDSILRACSIDPESLLDPDARVPRERFERVWKEAAAQTGDPCIGLHAGQHIHPRAVNLLIYLMLSSATLGEGMTRVARYQAVVSGTPWIGLRADDGLAYVRVGSEGGDPETSAIQAEYLSLLVLAFLEWVADQDLGAVEMRYRHDPRGPRDEYGRAFRCPVRFSCQDSELVLSLKTLDLPSAHANPSLARLHDEFAARLLVEAQEGSTVARTRRALLALLDSGESDIEKVARRLGMSARTLQRKLSQEGHSFRAVLDTLRRELADHHLRLRRDSIAETAHLTGFSEASAFSRAVRRWFGRTPRELRDASPPADREPE